MTDTGPNEAVVGDRPVLELLRRISLRDYRATPGRLALVIGGVASGVALIAALGIINVSVLANFRASIERAAGKAALQVALGTGEVGFDEAATTTVQQDPDVALAFGLVRGYLAATDGTGTVLQLYGVDLTSEAVDSYDVELVDRERDILELLNDPTSVFLTEDYAARRGIKLDDRVPFESSMGVKELRVRGLLRAAGLATVFGGNLAIMDLPAAQRLLGKDGKVDQVDVVLKPDRSAGDVQTRLAARLPSSLSVTRPVTRGERLERVLEAFRAMLDGISILALLAGVFIVYNTMSTAITQRARDLAVLIALGTERRTVFSLVVIEAAVLGAIASGVGMLAGLGLAHVILGMVSTSMGVIYQARFTVDSLSLTGHQVLSYGTLGIGSAVAAALVPARKASRLDPLELMRADFRERLAVGLPNGRLLAIAGVFFLATVAAVYREHTTRSIAWGNIGAILWFIVAIVLSIPLMSLVTTMLRPVFPRWFGIEGRVAIEGLRRSPGRTGVTTGVIALSLTFAVAISSIARSFRESERNWFILNGDLVVSAITTEGGWLEMPLSREVATILERVPGVGRIETYRALQGQSYRDARIAVTAVSSGLLDASLTRQQIVAGDPSTALAEVEHGDAVLVSENLADRYPTSVGDTIVVPTPSGEVSFRVAGVIAADFSGDQGSIVLKRDLFERLWGDTRVSHFNLFLSPGASLDDVRDRVTRALAKDYRVKVLTVPNTLAYHQGMVDRAFAFTYAIQLLVVAVTLAGIVDVLTTQVIERRREVGTFLALGAEASQVARAVRLEALVIGVAGALLGTILSVGTSFLWVRFNFRILIGYMIDHHFAFVTAAWCVVLTGAVATLAGHLAARRVLRQPVLDTLRQE